MKKTLLTLIAFILGLNAFSQIPNYVPSNGLVGWWPLNGGNNDGSGNNHNLIPVGTVSFTADRFGNQNSSVFLDGNSFLSVLQTTLPQNNSNRSVSAWFNSNLSILEQTLFSQYGIDQCNKFFSLEIACDIDINNPSNHFLFWAGCNDRGWNPSVSSINSSILTNTWEHVVLVYEDNFMTLYRNGIALNTIQNSYFYFPTSLETQPNFALGYSGKPSHPRYFSGNIDDIGIWNRALTECEIQDLYHAQLNSASLSISAGADQSICAGDNVTLNGTGGSNYQWNNNVVDGQAFAPAQSNSYVLTAQDSLGCTGIDTVVVTVLENATSTLTQTALDSYTLNGQTYTQSGTYTQTLTAANGCDSTITLNLTLNFTGIDELGTNAKKLVNITDLNGKTIPRRKNTLMLFIYEDGSVERVVEMEE